MKSLRLLPLAAAIACALWANAAERITVKVANPSGLARPSETIAVPFDRIVAAFPDMMLDHLAVRDASGAILPAQGTNFDSLEHPDNDRDFLFQHSFVAGETEASFTIEKTDYPVPPFPSKVFARYVPERFDDFAWENDKIAHRTYGPSLDTPLAGDNQMVSSGMDIWSKKVSYPIIDRWYLKEHYHDDTGEGLDMYDVGTARGCGGTGIWDGSTLAVSHNWGAWKVLANGPIQAVFELSYDPWDAGNGTLVTETKRFYVNAGHNLDRIESTFTFEGPETLTIGIGVTTHQKKAEVIEATNTDSRWTSLWENFRAAEHGSLGTAVLVDPKSDFEGFAATATDRLALVQVKSGIPVTYYAGAGWDQAGEFTSQADWEAYLSAYYERLANPVTLEISSQ